MTLFNPLLPLLILISLAPLLIRRRSPFALAWAAVGLMGVALLSPALRLPDGLPSPAAQVGEVAPWEASSAFDRLDESSARLGNPVQRDVTYQIQPWMLFLRAEYRAGRMPYWNPYQSAGTPFWGNGQSAPLFPLHLLFVVLPLPAGWTLLAWLRLMIAGLGAWALARRLDLSSGAALVPALVYPASGMLVGFLLYPMANALALVPWVLWATERMISDRPARLQVATLAFVVCLQALGGHPETVLHTALLSTVYLLVRARRFWARGALWMSWAGAWFLGVLVAAVQLVPFALVLRDSSRWQALSETVDAVAPPLTILLAQSLRAVVPDLYGHPVDGTWFGPFNYLATAVYSGLLVLPLAIYGLGAIVAGFGPEAEAKGEGERGTDRIDRRWLGVAAMGGFSWLAAYHLPGMRHLLEALPLIDRTLHHRLIFGVILVAALLAGAGVQHWLRGRSRCVAMAVAVGLTASLLAITWWISWRDWQAQGLMNFQFRWLLWAVVLLTAWVASFWLDTSRRHRVLPVLLLILAFDLVMVHARLNPGLSNAALYPETPALRLLQERSAQEGFEVGRIAAVGDALRPNTATVFRLHDVRGDDTVKLASYEAAYRERFGSGHPTYFRPIESWNEQALDQLAVHWVLGSTGGEVPAQVSSGVWREIYRGADARIWGRSEPPAPVRWARQDTGDLTIIDRSPGHWLIAWRTAEEARLTVSEAWAVGWSATSDGRAVPLEQDDAALMSVRLGPGEGRLELRYRPPGLTLGLWISLLALLGSVGVGVAEWRTDRARRAREVVA